MANKSLITNKRTHHLTKSGGKNYSLVIPIEFVRQLHWRERQKINLILKGDQIIVKDWKK